MAVVKPDGRPSLMSHEQRAKIQIGSDRLPGSQQKQNPSQPSKNAKSERRRVCEQAGQEAHPAPHGASVKGGMNTPA